MKAVNVFIAVLGILVALPVQFYLGWLLYNHVHATELMWFLWWMLVPLNVLVQVASAVAKATSK